ncbi:type VII secretion protein EccCa [Corynebacterium choanae]|uniref:ESX-1 secretion system protein EccCa1 n=1 Tax=Corynebacterium choanae TaxID=1862358 RepID=A0A3G6J8F7_9CORY|nr:type VII secretion protein EccCa [Corynebacterium choanae]AZA14276.1 ESX-1 secretion system protein EccCa1 [Corynebacterium choanae]
MTSPNHATRQAVVVPIRTMDDRIPWPEPPHGDIAIEAIPAAEKPSPQPLMRWILPLIMVVVFGAMIAMMVLRGGGFNPMMLLFPVMMLASMAAMFGGNQTEDVTETRRTYLRHLQQVRRQAQQHSQQQRRYLTHRFPASETLWSMLHTPRLWERDQTMEDFGWVRIATGEVALATPVQLAQPGAPEDLDPVCAISAAHVIDTVSTVPDCPVGLTLTDFPVIALTGPGRTGMARSLIVQLAFHHGPDSITITTLGSGFDWVKWLPHARHTARNNTNAHHILVIGDAGPHNTTDYSEFDTIIDVASTPGSNLWRAARDSGLILHLAPTPTSNTTTTAVAKHRKQSRRTSGLTQPHLLPPVTRRKHIRQRTTPTFKHPFRSLLTRLHPTPERSHLQPQHHPLPPSPTQNVSYQLAVETAAGKEVLGQADTISLTLARETARQLTGYRRAITTGSRQSSGMLQLCGITSPQQHTPAAMWPPLAAKARLAVPIGVTTTGHPVVLDLKEAAQGGYGPHGLCIGATGSGKSELLRSLVVGLALTHSPDDVNFVLVDFKGGATFLGLDGLPHTSAVITNLAEEAVLVERMQEAIEGEMHRRQELLRRAGNCKNVDDYRHLRQNNPALPPLPALVIVLDEFSELLGQHPDFADLFTAVGRLGRSLHMHLLLASQRLEEGRLRGLDSHLSYRLGLKTFSAAESRQVLGVVDAYHLPQQPGVGLLRTDAEALTQFQAAYVSGKLDNELTAAVEAMYQLPAPTMFTHADVLSEAVVKLPSPTYGDTAGQQDATLVDYTVRVTSDAAALRQLKAHQIWLPPLPAVIDAAPFIRDIQQPPAGEMSATLGLIDRPRLQRQDPYVVQLTGSNGHVAVCGAPRSGTSTALRTLLAGLAATHSSATLRMYIIDYSGHALDKLAMLPHVAAVACRGEEEKIRRIIAEVIGLIDQPANDTEHTLLVIDGWQGFMQEFGDTDLSDQCIRIVTDGLGARVHMVLSVQRWALLRPAIKDVIGLRLELHLTDSLDSVLDRKAQQRLPAIPGRGLTHNAEPMQFTTVDDALIAEIAANSAARGDIPTRPLRMLPTAIETTTVDTSQPVTFAIGGPLLSAVVFNPDRQDHLVCFGARGAGKSTMLATVAEQLSTMDRSHARLVVIDPRRRHLGAFQEDMIAAYASSADQIVTAIKDLQITLQRRLPSADISPEQLRARSWWQGPELFVLVDDFDLLPDGALHPLVPLIPHAKDIGLHLVIARKTGGAARAMWDPLISAVKDSTPVVVLLDCDREEGSLFGIKPRHFAPGRATVSIDGDIVGECQILLPAVQTQMHEQPRGEHAVPAGDHPDHSDHGSTATETESNNALVGDELTAGEKQLDDMGSKENQRQHQNSTQEAADLATEQAMPADATIIDPEGSPHPTTSRQLVDDRSTPPTGELGDVQSAASTQYSPLRSEASK